MFTMFVDHCFIIELEYVVLSVSNRSIIDTIIMTQCY